MAQYLRALAALPEDPGSVPSTHMAAHAVGNPSSETSNTLTQTYTQTGTNAHKIKLNKRAEVGCSLAGEVSILHAEPWVLSLKLYKASLGGSPNPH